MPTPVTVKKWGSRMAVLIPWRFAKDRKIDVGATLDIDNISVIKPKRRRYKLPELMKGYKPSHRHREWDQSGPVGNELL